LFVSYRATRELYVKLEGVIITLEK
jgi:hypothetical protein